MLFVVLPDAREVVHILGSLLGTGGDGHIALGRGIRNLHIVGEQVLREEPGGEHFLRVAVVKDAHGRPLGDHLRVGRIELGHHAHCGFKGDKLVAADVGQRGLRAHPGGAGGGVHGKDALAGVEEVGRIAGNLEGGEGAVGDML